MADFADRYLNLGAFGGSILGIYIHTHICNTPHAHTGDCESI